MKRMLLPFLMFCVAFLFLSTGYAGEEEMAEETLEIIFVDETDNEDLAANYIHRIMYMEPQPSGLRGKYIAGSSLTGVDWVLYSRLRSDIAEVAAGNRESTVFKYMVADVHSQVTFTAEDLSLETLTVDGTLTEEAKTAAKQRIRSYNASSIVYSLLADCPYELYWYNKTSSGGCTVAVALPCTLSDDGQSVTVGGYLKFSMAVSDRYATGAYTINTSYGQAAAAAVENAQDIVQQYEDENDYDRLLAYKNAICGLTSYNHEAEDAGDAVYGDPWQLVWVFDGDETTNVVCEGYAKAFQYLNDLSASPTTVISVQGTMDGRRHMWNIVSMDNDRNYFVDVTNCDTGMIGYPDKLFLVGYRSGSVLDGYQMKIGTTYVYNNKVFTNEELTLSSWDYTDAWPGTPICDFSASRGYVGYKIAVRLNEDADGVIILETGEKLPCTSRIVLIPMTKAGEQSYSIAAVRDGLMSDYSETYTIQITERSGPAQTLPSGMKAIEDEAFRGSGMSMIIVPPSVETIGDYAFADNETLCFAEIGSAALGEGVFDQCPNLICCFEEADKGFSEGLNFVVK